MLRSVARVTRIAVPDLVSNSYFPAIAAAELGYLDAQGVEPEVELIFPVSRAMNALRAGDVDFVAGAAHATVEVFPAWNGAKLLLALAQGMYWFLVLHLEIGARRGELEAIKGLRIGAAPGPDAGLRRLLRDAGIDVERDDVGIGPLPVPHDGASFGIAAARALENREIDGFWANGMGAEVAVRRGVGSIILDTRRGDGPARSWHYTFPALVATQALIERDADLVASVVRGVVACQAALRADPARATEVGRRLFPPLETSLIATLIERDAPFYEPAISEDAVAHLNDFCQDIGLLEVPARYADVVATRFSQLWAPRDGEPSRGVPSARASRSETLGA